MSKIRTITEAFLLEDFITIKRRTAQSDISPYIQPISHIEISCPNCLRTCEQQFTGLDFLCYDCGIRCRIRNQFLICSKLTTKRWQDELRELLSK